MKTKSVRLLLAQIVLLSALAAHARTVTLVVNRAASLGPTNASAQIEIATNETAEVISVFGSELYDESKLYITQNGVTYSFRAVHLQSGNSNQGNVPVRLIVAGPAVLQLATGHIGSSSAVQWFCTVRIEPESFPPGQTLILPAGTVGSVHAQSSTNLIEWRDEWVHTFANTNENRFFRLSAERSTP